MNEKAKKHLFDLQQAIANIFSFIGDEPNFELYQANLMMRKAVGREFMTIGEVANRLKKEGFDNLLQNQGNIIAYRNFLIHTYDAIVNEKVWTIIIEHLPKLLEEVKELLQEDDQ